MSSALGPVDPGRLQLSAAGRAAIEAQQQREAEQRRKEEAEQQKREEAMARQLESERQQIIERQQAAQRRPGLVFDPVKGWVFASSQPTAQDQDRDIQRQINEAISQFIKEEKVKGTVPTNIKAYYDDKSGNIVVEGKQFASVAPAPKGLAPTPAPSPKPISPTVDDDYPILTPTSGITSRSVYTGIGRGGQIETVIIGKQQQPGGELITVESRRPMDDVIEFSKTATIKPLPQGEPDMGFGYPVSGRPGVFEEVGAFGSLQRTAVIQTDKPLADVKLYDSAVQQIVFGKPTEKVAMGLGDRAGIGDIGYDFPEGYKAYFENVAKIPELAVSPLTKREPEFKPEAEGEFFAAVGKGAVDLFTGKPMTVAEDLGELGRRISESPYYYAGSLFATGALIVATQGTGPLVRSGSRAGISILQRIRPRQAQEIAETVGRTRGLEDITIQALGRGERPLISRTGFYTRPTPAKLLVPKVEVVGEAAMVGLRRLEVPAKAEQILIRAGKEPAEEIGVILPKQGEIKIVSTPLTQKEKLFEMGTELVEPKVGMGPPKPVPRQLEPGTVAAKAVEDVFPEGLTGGKASELAGRRLELPTYTPDIEVGTSISPARATGVPFSATPIKVSPTLPKRLVRTDLVRVKGKEPVGAIITYDIAAVKKAAKAGAKRQKQVTGAGKALSEMPAQVRALSIKAPSVVLETMKKTAGAPIKVQPVSVKATPASATAVAQAAKDVGFAGVGRGISPSIIEDVEVVSLATPKGAQVPSMKAAARLDTRLKLNVAEAPASAARQAESLLPKTFTTRKTKLDLGTAPRQAILTLPRVEVTTRQRVSELLIPRRTTRTTPRLDVPTPPRLTTTRHQPPPVPPARPVGAKQKRKRRFCLGGEGIAKSKGLGVKSVFSPRKQLGQFDILPEGARSRKRFLKL